MKALVFVIHPNLGDRSIVNKHWFDELKKYPEKFTVHNLYELYPDGNIDVEAEQKLVEAHEKIVFQFPVYWLSSPPLFKKWLDEVLSYGWAYGAGSYKLEGKKIALALTTSADEKTYSEEGAFKYTLKEFTRTFEITFEWIKADYRPYFAFFGAPHTADEANLKKIEQSAKDYVSYVETL
ncbi:NAD(P)H-dependent oxidoreductase [Arcticibacter eurypsychrophilus]|uniref:NAD(P)H-dependent oxidoreductase n=1 Tax=Arcticibacter eurypsychrophilus TaxID=1434752 RepID=UPI00084CF1FD|nr:NAD(P)H-dependent oxidoreductase [Arcticibacter eurypsychrophilus]